MDAPSLSQRLFRKGPPYHSGQNTIARFDVRNSDPDLQNNAGDLATWCKRQIRLSLISAFDNECVRKIYAGSVYPDKDLPSAWFWTGQVLKLE